MCTSAFNRELFAGMWLESRVFSSHNLISTECEETSVTEDMGIFSLADVLSGSTRGRGKTTNCIGQNIRFNL
jgi:hypothetical protein